MWVPNLTFVVKVEPGVVLPSLLTTMGMVHRGISPASTLTPSDWFGQ